MVSAETEKELALVLLIKAIFDQLDEISSLKAQGYSAAISSQILGEMSSVLKDLPLEDLELYHQLLLKLTAQREPSDKPKFSPQYAEYVAPSKRKLIERVRSSLSLEAA